MSQSFSAIQSQLGEKASYYLEHQSKTVSKEKLHLPGPDFVSREFGNRVPPSPRTRSISIPRTS
jgi:class I fructose-bisphosphate aldolase